MSDLKIASYSMTDASFIRGETTACESAMPNTTVKADSLANLTRQAILIQGAAFPIGANSDQPSLFIVDVSLT